jgi:hypothetical protein
MAQVTASLCGYSIDATAGGVSFTRSLGVTPNVNTIPLVYTVSPVPSMIGSLVLSDGQGGAVTIPSCRIDSTEAKRSKDGTVTLCQVSDRRWQWAYGYIVGEYNLQHDDGSLDNQQNVQALAALCLTAMGESSYDVSALPTNIYPYVNWQFANPARELAALCDELGFAVALLLTDAVKIVKLGSGAAFPSGATKESAPGVKVSGQAGKYACIGGRSVIQIALPLAPVGLDLDGSIKPLADLEYHPLVGAYAYGGFEKYPYRPQDNFSNLAFSPMSDRYKRADESVFKWFQIPQAWLYILPLLAEIVDTEVVNGVTKRKAPYVTALDDRPIVIFDPSATISAGVVKAAEYEIDSEKGLVKFHSRQAVLVTASPYDGRGDIRPPQLTLTLAYKSIQPTGVTESDYYVRTAGAGSLVEILSHPDLVGYGIQDPNTFALTWTNTDALDAAADLILEAADPGVATFTSRTGLFVGIKSAFDLDGCMRSITYHAGADGATTQVQYNLEFPRAGAPSYEERGRRVETCRSAGIVKAHQAEIYGNTPAAGTARRSVQTHAGVDPDLVMCMNVSSTACPKGGVAMTVGFDTTANVEKVCPLLPGRLRIRIAAADVAVGAVGPFWKGGVRPVYSKGSQGVTAGMRFTGDGKWGLLAYSGKDAGDSPRFGALLVHSTIVTGHTDYLAPLADWLMCSILADNGCDVTYMGGNPHDGFNAMAVEQLVFMAEFCNYADAGDLRQGVVIIGRNA